MNWKLKSVELSETNGSVDMMMTFSKNTHDVVTHTHLEKGVSPLHASLVIGGLSKTLEAIDKRNKAKQPKVPA